MEYIVIPKPVSPSYNIKTTLDGTNYIIRLNWNQRSGWFLGLSDASDDVIFSPKKLTVGTDLLSGETDERRPPGALVVVDYRTPQSRPEYESLSGTHQIFYLSAEDLGR